MLQQALQQIPMLAQVGESITAERDLRSHRLNHRSPGNIPRQPSGSPPFNPLQWNSVAISPLDFTFEPPATSRIRRPRWDAPYSLLDVGCQDGLLECLTALSLLCPQAKAGKQQTLGEVGDSLTH